MKTLHNIFLSVLALGAIAQRAQAMEANKPAQINSHSIAKATFYAAGTTAGIGAIAHATAHAGSWTAAQIAINCYNTAAYLALGGFMVKGYGLLKESHLFDHGWRGIRDVFIPED